MFFVTLCPMQWIALDETQSPVTACRAIKKKLYFCPECASPVLLRSGPHRQAHFCHVRSAPHCVQHQKTEEHLGLQLLFASRIPGEEGQIERPFEEIGRIADVAWVSRKIVFEIQCSPISLKEAEQRCQDYRSLGWEILWILSDKRFNGKNLSAAERYLRQQTSYFSCWQRKLVYDQCEILQGFRRVYKGPPIPVDPFSVTLHSAEEGAACTLPTCLKERWDSWKLRVEGDILTQASREEPRFIPIFNEIEQRFETKRERLPWPEILKRCYLQLLKKCLHLLAVRDV